MRLIGFTRNSIVSAISMFVATVLVYSALAQTSDAQRIVIDDHFTSKTLAGRTMARGDWVIAENSASVKFNAEYFKKYADHGALLSYDTKLTNADVAIEFTPMNFDSVIFTLDAAGGGHVFRIVFRSDAPSVALTFTNSQSGEKANPVVLLKDIAKIHDGQLNRLTVKIEDDKVVFSINGEAYSASNELINRPKAITKFGIQHGDLSVSHVAITQR